MSRPGAVCFAGARGYSLLTLTSLVPVTLPPSGPVSAETLTLRTAVPSAPSLRVWGILAEYPQEPPQPYSMLPLATVFPSESSTATAGAGGSPRDGAVL